MNLPLEHLRRAAEAAKKLQEAELQHVFDGHRPGSRPTPAQLAILKDASRVQFKFVIAGVQSGKSSIGARELAWIANENHPYGWKRHPDAGTGPLVLLIIGQDRRQIELNLWAEKVAPLLDMTQWREVRNSQSLQYIEHKTKGHKIVLLSHSDSSDRNRKAIQGWVVDHVWQDEMCSSVKMQNEMMSRVNSKRGTYTATFSPMIRSAEVRKMIEALPEPIGKIYRLSKLDNPINNKEAELAKVAGLSEELQAAILYGEWLPSEGGVYYYNADEHGGGLPETYAGWWRHVAVADPATESKTGFSVWAEDPETHLWWCTQSDYVTVSDKVPTKIIEEIERRLTGLNVIERRADSAESWFIRQANSMGYPWRALAQKNGIPKDTMIRMFQEALGSRIRVPEFNTKFVDEIQSCERSPTTGNIVRASTYHITDTAHYFVLHIPEPVTVQRPKTRDERLLEEHWRREADEAARAKKPRYSRPPRPLVSVDSPKEPPLIAPAPRRASRGGWRRSWKIS